MCLVLTIDNSDRREYNILVQNSMEDSKGWFYSESVFIYPAFWV
jgi:hypothetical protein